MNPKGDRSFILQLPADDTLQRSALTEKDLESLVKSILSGQVGRGIDNVILRGGKASGGAGAALDWTKTIWSRAC